MSTPLRIVSRSIGGARRRVRTRPASLLVLSALTAVGFGVVVYFASTSLAWFATSPTGDPNFGALNECLMQHVPSGRAGYAVSKDGRRAASFNDRGLAVCGADGEGRFVPLPGISRLSWDHNGALWIAAHASGPGLWRLRGQGIPERVGELSPVALAGHAAGVAALDSSGRLVSLGDDGHGLGFFELPTGDASKLELLADSEGELLAVVAHGGIWILRARDLSIVRADSPCDAQFLWWLPQPGAALVSCGPDESWALAYQVLSNVRETAPRRTRVHSTLATPTGTYVLGCEGLPCSASAPLD